MNSNEFITAIRKVVRDAAIKHTIENLENPPGRKVPEDERKRSEWFNSLPYYDRHKIERIVADAVDEAIFGFLAVIDGVRSIESKEYKGKIELKYIGMDQELLNDPEKIGLHDIYNAID